MKRNNRKKRIIRKGPFVFLAVLVLIVFIAGHLLMFFPLTEFQASTSTQEQIQQLLKPHCFLGFLPAKTAMNIPLKNIVGDSLQSKKLERIGLFHWRISIFEPSTVFYISINDYLYPCDFEGNILTISNVTGSLLQGNEDLLYKISIPTTPLEPSEEKTQYTAVDFIEVYHQYVQPFIRYIVQTSSYLGPQITSIQYSNEKGLVFTKISTSGKSIQCIFGKETSYGSLEKKLIAAEEYLREQDVHKNFNCIDVRFRKQAVCSDTKQDQKIIEENNDTTVSP
ncbi:MAG TPA: hypothetical protein PLE09_05820 [Caldisericia bacterium]|nr:hypothetical protein [Caldisericia bacterium]